MFRPSLYHRGYVVDHSVTYDGLDENVTLTIMTTWFHVESRIDYPFYGEHSTTVPHGYVPAGIIALVDWIYDIAGAVPSIRPGCDRGVYRAQQ